MVWYLSRILSGMDAPFSFLQRRVLAAEVLERLLEPQAELLKRRGFGVLLKQDPFFVALP